MTMLLTHGIAFDIAAQAGRRPPIDMQVIALALAKLCRHGGQPAFFYSMAQHTRLVAEIVGRRQSLPQPQAGLYALLCSGHEAFLGHITREMRAAMARRLPDFPVIWQDMAAPLDEAIFAAAGLPAQMPADIAAAVRQASAQMEAAEIEDLFPATPDRAARLAALPRPQQVVTSIRPENWAIAGDRWLRTYRALRDQMPPSEVQACMDRPA